MELPKARFIQPPFTGFFRRLSKVSESQNKFNYWLKIPKRIDAKRWIAIYKNK
jgi:hypothetical protein